MNSVFIRGLALVGAITLSACTTAQPAANAGPVSQSKAANRPVLPTPFTPRPDLGKIPCSELISLMRDGSDEKPSKEAEEVRTDLEKLASKHPAKLFAAVPGQIMWWMNR
ncbi:hypothetical protein [Massilia glaciei]|uniref:hypothetical protein n=1 Tax=Massilia glaciei TaxID=1524097 RepID=UPI0011B24F13|nr:hypothetical protein [Massilia glaciei]